MSDCGRDGVSGYTCLLDRLTKLGVLGRGGRSVQLVVASIT